MQLPPDEVHVWYAFSASVTDPSVYGRYASWLTPDERARHDRYAFPRDRHNFLLARGMLRSLLSRYLGLAPAECSFDVNPHGRPRLHGAAAPLLDFNLSHTAGLVACAFGKGCDVGVDVEDVERAITARLARRFFSAAEAAALEALPIEERRSRFFDYWTLKEAYVKARGTGLFAVPLDGFAMELAPPAPPRIRFSTVDDDPQRWQFAQFNPAVRYRLALAVRREGNDRAVRVQEFDASEL